MAVQVYINQATVFKLVNAVPQQQHLLLLCTILQQCLNAESTAALVNRVDARK